MIASLLLEHFPYLPNLFHPLTGNGYQAWSGIITCSFIGTAFVTFWHKHNCHEHRCLRLAWHPDQGGHPVCKVHHPEHPSLGWFRSNRGHPRHASHRRLKP